MNLSLIYILSDMTPDKKSEDTMEHEQLTKREVVKELMRDCENHVKCLVCGECVTCNLRPCRDNKEHIAMPHNFDVKRLENNTFEVTYSNGNKAIRYHHTDIITYHPNGDIVLNTDEYLTSTTKERMGYLIDKGYRITQENKIWYLWKTPKTREQWQKWIYKDEMVIHADGTVTGNGTDPKHLLKLDKQITKYVDGFIKSLFDGKIEKPGPGDCWYCGMQTEDKKPLGVAMKDKDHILSHFEEKYYVPLLLMNAIETFPISEAARASIGYHLKYHNQNSECFDNIARIQVKSSLRRYLRRQLGLAA